MESSRPSTTSGTSSLSLNTESSKDSVDSTMLTEKLIIGGKGASGIKVEKVVSKLASVAGKDNLRENILAVMVELGTEEEKRGQIVRNLKHDTMLLTEAILAIMTEWMCRVHREATVQKLVEVLETCGLTKHAGELKEAFLGSALQ